jgi:hypothetical protein
MTIFSNIHFVVPVKIGIINQINLWINTMTWQINEHVLKYAMKIVKVNSTVQLTERSLCTYVQRVGLNVYVSYLHSGGTRFEFLLKTGRSSFLFLRKIPEYTAN